MTLAEKREQFAWDMIAKADTVTILTVPEVGAILRRAESGEFDDALPKERCICAAMRLPDGEIVRGKRHDNCIRTAVGLGANRDDIANSVQGFMTDGGRFVDRKEGMRIQKVCGRPSAYSHDGAYRGEILFSEDLY